MAWTDTGTDDARRIGVVGGLPTPRQNTAVRSPWRRCVTRTPANSGTIVQIVQTVRNAGNRSGSVRTIIVRGRQEDEVSDAEADKNWPA